MRLPKHPSGTLFFEEEEELYWQILAELFCMTPPDVISYSRNLRVGVPSAPFYVDASNAREAQRVLAECANNATLLGDIEIDLLGQRGEWRELQYHSERLYKLGVHNRVSAARSKTKEAREFETELLMGEIVQLFHHVSSTLNTIETLMDEVKSRVFQLERVHKTVSRQVAIFDLMITNRLEM